MALSEVTWSCAFVAVSDQPTGRAFRLNPDVTARAIWQAVRMAWAKNGPWILFTSITSSIYARKVLLHAVNLRPTNLGSSGEHANH
jgi:hypothetical protein